MQSFEQIRVEPDQSRGGWMRLGRLLSWSMRNCGKEDVSDGTQPGIADIGPPRGASLDAAA